MTPDEVRMLDNRYAHFFLYAESAPSGISSMTSFIIPMWRLRRTVPHRPIPTARIPGALLPWRSASTRRLSKTPKKMEAEKHEFLLYSEEELEELLDEKEKKDNEEA